MYLNRCTDEPIAKMSGDPVVHARISFFPGIPTCCARGGKSGVGGEIRCRFAFSGKNDELTPDFPQNDELTPDFPRARSGAGMRRQRHGERLDRNARLVERAGVAEPPGDLPASGRDLCGIEQILQGFGYRGAAEPRHGE